MKALLEAEEEPEWRALVEANLEELRESIDRLGQMAGLLKEALGCGCQAFDACPVIEREAAGIG